MNIEKYCITPAMLFVRSEISDGKPSFTGKNIRAIIDIDYLELSGRECIEKYTFFELERIYNGAGPDRWSDTSRDIVTALMNLYRPAIVIHDVQFHESDGTVETFDHVTQCWIDNCRKIFDFHYPLLTWQILKSSYRVKRAYWYSVMKAGNLAVSGKKGLAAWIDSCERAKGVL